MSEWFETTLGEVASVTGGGTPSSKEPDYWNGDVLWVTPGEVTKREGRVIDSTNRTITATGLASSSAKLLPEGAVLLTSRATVGAVALAGQPMATNQGFQSLVAGPEVLPRFLMYWIQHHREEFTSRASGSTFPEISGKKVKAIPIALPPLNQQRRIVDVVAAVDAQTDALIAEAQAAWDSYLNATGVLWGDESGREADLLPLGDVMAIDVLRVPLDPSTEYRLAGVLNAGKGLVNKGSFRGSETNYSGMNRLRTGQVVMRKLTAWEGPIAVVTEDFDGFVASNEFPTFSLGERMSPAWFSHVCRAPRLWDEMRLRVTGSVQRRKRLNPDQLLSVKLPIPPVEIQRRTATALDALLESKSRAAGEAKHLRAFRSTLLTALLSQSICIPESYDALLDADPSALEGAPA